MLSLLLLLLLLVAPAAAATRHFAVTGSNLNPCTEAAPCLTAGPYEAEAQPGDRFLFRRGDVFRGKQFQLLPTRSGAEGNPIYYGAYGTGDKPLFDAGDPQMSGHGGSKGVFAKKTDWVIMEDLAFVGWFSAMDLGGTRDMVIRRITSTGGSSSACFHVAWYGGRTAERIVIEDVELAKCGINSNGEGIYIGTNPGKEGAGATTSDVTVRRAYIHSRDNSEGIEVKNCVRGVTIEDSRIVGAGTNAHGHGIAIAPSSTDCPGHNGEHIVRRNVIEGSPARGIHMGTGGTIEHNVLLRNGAPTESAGIWVEDVPGDGHAVVIERNVIAHSAGAAIQVQASAQAATSLSGNLAWGNGSGNTPRPLPPPDGGGGGPLPPCHCTGPACCPPCRVLEGR